MDLHRDRHRNQSLTVLVEHFDRHVPRVAPRETVAGHLGGSFGCFPLGSVKVWEL
jgi:hypothetical protein